MTAIVRVHDSELPFGYYWACQRIPLVATDPGPVFDERCPLCQARAAAIKRHYGDMPVFDVATAEKGGKLSDLVGWGLTEWK